MTFSDSCGGSCCNDIADSAVPQVLPEPAKVIGYGAFYGDVDDVVSTAEDDDCADACCSSSPKPTPASSVTFRICRAAEFPSCCAPSPAACPTTASAAVCRAPTAAVCCSPQVGVSPSATIATPLKSSPKLPDLRWWRRAAMLVSLATILWNVVEGSLGLAYGAEDFSVALLGFGADSWIEVLSAVAIAHRFWAQEGSRSDATAKERRATLIIGSLLIVLALSIAGGAVSALGLHETPVSSVSGIVISSAAIAVMTALYFVKVHVALALSSSAMESDAQCSLCCIQLSSVLFVGSLVSFFAGGTVWWFDGATSLVIALLVGREGLSAVRNARRPDFNGCGCCDENSGWYVQWLRKRRRAGQ